MPLGTCRQGHHETHTPHDGKQSTAGRFLTSAGRTAPDTDGHTDTDAHNKGRGCLEHPLLLELELKLARQCCGVAIPGPRAPSRTRESLRLDPYSAHGCGRRAGRFCAGFCKRQATGPPERLTRGVESGGGRREAAGRAGEGRWMEGMEGWRGGGGGGGEGDITDAGDEPRCHRRFGLPHSAPMSSGADPPSTPAENRTPRGDNAAWSSGPSAQSAREERGERELARQRGALAGGRHGDIPARRAGDVDGHLSSDPSCPRSRFSIFLDFPGCRRRIRTCDRG